MRIKVGDNTYKIKYLTRKKYDELLPDYTETQGLCNKANRTLYFADDDTDYLNTIRHELFHAYFDLTLVNSSSLDMSQTEELCGEIVGKYGEELVKNSKKIYSWIKGKQKKCTI